MNTRSFSDAAVPFASHNGPFARTMLIFMSMQGMIVSGRARPNIYTVGLWAIAEARSGVTDALLGAVATICRTHGGCVNEV